MSGETWNRLQFAWGRSLLRLRQCGRLTPGAFELGHLLSLYADQNGEAWPGQDRMAAEMGVSTRSIKRHLAALADVGMLRILPGCGRGNRSVYALIVPEDGPGQVVHIRRGNERKGGQKGDSPVTVSREKRGQPCPEKGTIGAPHIENFPQRTSKARAADDGTVSRRWSAWNGGVWLRQDGAEVARWQAWLAGMGMGDPVALCPRRGDGAEVEIRLPTYWLPDPGSISEMLVLSLFRDLTAEAAETAQSESRRQA
jgi:hypothetical protein